jgi:hypothetical protein
MHVCMADNVNISSVFSKVFGNLVVTFMDTLEEWEWHQRSHIYCSAWLQNYIKNKKLKEKHRLSAKQIKRFTRQQIVYLTVTNHIQQNIPNLLTKLLWVRLTLFHIQHSKINSSQAEKIISGAVCLLVSGKRLYPYLVRGWNKPIFLPLEVSLSHSRWH